MPKDGKGVRIDKAKAILKKYAIPIAGVSAATIIAIATALTTGDQGEAFVFHSLSDLSHEEFKRLLGGDKKEDTGLIFRGDGARLDKAKAFLKEHAVPIAGATAAIIISLASVMNKSNTDGNDRATLAKFLGGKRNMNADSLNIMFANVNKSKFRKEYPDIARKIRLRGGCMECEKRAELGGAKERPKRKTTNSWVKHVKNYAEKHNLCYREALKSAGATYVRQKK